MRRRHLAIDEPSRLLLLAATTGYQTCAFSDAADRLGIELVLATDRCHILENPWGDRAIPVRFEDLGASVAVLIAEHRKLSFNGIVAVGDRPTVLAAHIGKALDIPYNSPDSVQACRDKHLARRLYQAAGLAVPSFFKAALDEDPREAARRAPFPCVLKPLGLSASRGVIRANHTSEFVSAFERIKALLESPDILRMGEDQNRYLQIESFIPGREYALEGLLTDNGLQLLALFDKPDPLDGPFFEETIYVTPSRAGPETQHALITTVERAVRALGMTLGPVHAELRFNQQGAWMLEAAARPIGGLCARALTFDTDMRLEELILRHAAGEDVSGVRLMGPASGVMMIPIPKAGIFEDVSGIERAGKVPGVQEVIITAKQGQKLVLLPEGASYLGFIFARCESPEQVEVSLREAHRQLQFKIAATLPVFTGKR